LSESAKRGLEVFRDPKKGNCAVCHTIDEKSALFTDNKYHNLGVGVDTKGELADLGRYTETKVDADRGAFKTPTLRNITLTAPYMHDGSLNTVKDVIDFYIGGGNSNEWRDKEIHELGFLTGQERQDLQAFLESLTGEIPENVGPPTD
jgi:cytochrome c peroxidase